MNSKRNRRPGRKTSPPHASRSESLAARMLDLVARGRPHAGKWSLLVALYLVYFLLSVQLPHVADNWTCDLGGQMAFDYCAKNRYQVGIDIVHIIGPYGFLQYPHTYSGFLVAEKAVFGIFFGAMFSLLVLRACRYFSGRLAQGIWLLAVIPTAIPADPGGAGPDVLYYLTILMAAHHLLTRDRYASSRLFDLVLLTLLTLLALTKGTNLILVTLLMGALVCWHVQRRRYRAIAWEYGAVGAAFLVFWVLAGQHLENIPRFLLGMFSITSGYNEAMALSVPGSEYLVGLALGVWAVFFAATAVRLWFFRRFLERALLIGFEFALLFLVWKHGYIRADQHLMHFWTFVPAASVLWFIAHERNTWGGTAAPRLGILAAGCVFVLTGCALFSGPMATAMESTVRAMCCVKGERIGEDLRGLLHGRARFAALDEALARNRAVIAVPRIAATVADATVDFYGWMPGLVLLNGLNYKPRPMPVSFNVYNEGLMRVNAEFYRKDASAPSYVIAGIKAIDDRLAPQDDALALLELLRHYQYDFTDDGSWLVVLKRAPGRADEPMKPLGPPQQYAWGESIPLPDPHGDFLWCTVDIRYSLWGRLKSFLFKPRPVFINLNSQGKAFARFRFLPCAGKVGFLANPIILHNLDLLSVYSVVTSGPFPKTPQPDSIGFQTEPNDVSDGEAVDVSELEPNIAVSFFTVPAPERLRRPPPLAP